MNSLFKEDQIVAASVAPGDTRRSGRSYFEHLPVELQTQIFIECLEGRFSRFRCTEAPILLLRVCRSWRILASSVSQLWSSFEINLEDSSNSQAADSAEHCTFSELRLWLQRSKRRPLSFKVTCNPSMTSLNSTLAKVFTLLSQQSCRWRHVEFHVSSACLARILDSLPCNLVALDSVVLDAACSGHAPKSLNVRSLGTKWSRLTALHLNQGSEELLDLDDCATILSQCVDLSSCVLNAKCIFSGLHGMETVVVLPYLQEFRITLHGCESGKIPESCLVSFLAKLELNTLKDLHLEWLIRTITDPTIWSNYHPEFMGFIERLSPTLVTLQMSYLPMSESHLVQCLSSVPHLSVLDLRFPLGDAANDPVTDDFLTRLSFLDDSITETQSCHSSLSTLLPLLKSLNLTCHGEAWSPSVIIRFLDSRIRMKQQVYFKQFKLKTLRPTPECIGSRVTNWKEAGIGIAFQSVTIF